MVAAPSGFSGEVLASPLFPEKDILTPSRAVKRASCSFWEGNRLEDLLEVIAARAFAPGSKLTAADLARDARQSAACGHELTIHHPLPNLETGEVAAPYIHKGVYCQMPAVCPICSRRVGDVRQAKYAPRLAAAIDEGLRPYLVTFTIAAGDSLPDQLEKLRRALRVFQTRWRVPKGRRGRRFLAKGGRGGEWQKVVAAGLKIEVKRGELSGAWHVHAHALVFTRAMLDYRLDREICFRGRMVKASKISAEWYAATGGESMGVDVHPLFIDRKTGRRLTRDGMVSAAREIMKYTSILDERSTSEDWVTVRAGTWGRRLWSVYGAFRGLGEDDYTEEVEGVDLVDEVRVSWRGGWSGDYVSRGEPRRVDLAGRKACALKSLTLRARVNGMCRKMRSAILAARREYEASGVLPEAFDVEFISPSTGKPSRMVWPAPVYLNADSALDGRGWERWLDEITVAARSMLASLDADLSEVSHDDVLAYRWGADVDVSSETWEAWRQMLDIKAAHKERAAARDAVMYGGLQQDILTPDWFDRAPEFVASVDATMDMFRPGFFDPPDVGPPW